MALVKRIQEEHFYLEDLPVRRVCTAKIDILEEVDRVKPRPGEVLAPIDPSPPE